MGEDAILKEVIRLGLQFPIGAYPEWKLLEFKMERTQIHAVFTWHENELICVAALYPTLKEEPLMETWGVFLYLFEDREPICRGVEYYDEGIERFSAWLKHNLTSFLIEHRSPNFRNGNTSTIIPIQR